MKELCDRLAGLREAHNFAHQLFREAWKVGDGDNGALLYRISEDLFRELRNTEGEIAMMIESNR